MTRELVERAVRQGSIPPRLFKYRTLNNKTLDVLKKASMWFASPLDFNDPFDFQIEDVGGYSEADIRTYLARNRVPPHDIDRLVAGVASADAMTAIIEDAKKANFATKGVLCLSEIPDAMLMWSHYSDGHAGLVFELDVAADPDFFVTPIKAHYTDDYPLARFLTDGADAILPCVRTKALSWAYEREVRIIKNSTGPHPFNRAALAGVYFGCRATSTTVDTVSQLLADGGYGSTSLYQAARAHQSYGITFKTL